MTAFWLATAAAWLAPAIGATAEGTAGTTTPGRALCAEGSGRRAAPAASTAAATARATEAAAPSAGARVRPQLRVEPLALSSAGDLHRDCDIHRGGGPRVATGPEPATRPLSPPPPSLLPARILSPLCSQPRGSCSACTPRCGQSDGLLGWGWAGGALRRPPLPLPPPYPPGSGKQWRLGHGLGSRRNRRGRWRWRRRQDPDAALPPGAN